MTLVRFRIREADGTLVGGVNRTPGAVFVKPDRRHVLAGVVLPVPFQVVLNGLEVVHDIPPSGLDWVMTFREEVGTAGVTRYCAVPTSGATLNYEDLVDIDPISLTVVSTPEWESVAAAALASASAAAASAAAAAASAASAGLLYPDPAHAQFYLIGH